MADSPSSVPGSCPSDTGAGAVTTRPDVRLEQSTVFGHLPITFDDRVLRPRPWTVAQSRWVAEILHAQPDHPRVLELCAGAGHIGLLALAMADPVPGTLVAVDVNPAACAFIRRNAEATGLAGRVEVRDGAMADVLRSDERFDVVIADPPWVPRRLVPSFPEDPVLAVDGGDDGLDIARACLHVADRHIVPGGSVVLQLGSVEQVDLLRPETLDTGLVVGEVRTFGANGVLVLLTARGTA